MRGSNLLRKKLNSEIKKFILPGASPAFVAQEAFSKKFKNAYGIVFYVNSMSGADQRSRVRTNDKHNTKGRQSLYFEFREHAFIVSSLSMTTKPKSPLQTYE